MRRAKKTNGERRFQRNQWLKEGYIRGLFGRMSVRKRKGGDIIAPVPVEQEVEEDAVQENRRQFQNDLVNEIQEQMVYKSPFEQSHPIMVNNYPLCDLMEEYKQKGRQSTFWSLDFMTKIWPMLNLCKLNFNGKSKKKAAEQLIHFLKFQCNVCMDLDSM